MLAPGSSCSTPTTAKPAKLAPASSARIFLYCLRRFSVGHLCRPGTRRLHWKANLGCARPASNRSADSCADPHHILSARVASDSHRIAGLAAGQTSRARSRLLLGAGNARGRRLQLFLLRRYSTNQRGHRHHRAIHCSRLGVALRGGSPAAKKKHRKKFSPLPSPSPESPWSSIRSAPLPAPRSTSIPTASSLRCWHHFPSRSITSADTASSSVTTVGAWSSGCSPPPPLSDSSSTLPGKLLPPTTRLPNGCFCLGSR